MADRVYTDDGPVYRTNHGPSAVAWTALIVALLALVIGWMAYNRSGKDLEDTAADAVDTVQQGAQDAGENVQQGTDAVEQGVDNGPDGVDDGAQ